MEKTVESLSLIKGMKLLSIMDKHFVFDPATTFCAEIDESTWGVLSGYQQQANGQPASHAIKSLKRDFPAKLVDKVAKEWNSLVGAQKLGLPERTEYPESMPDTKLNTLVLSLAHGCNLRCKYCFAEHGTYGDDTCLMTREAARKAVEFGFENSEEHVSIIFFGGEPLLDKSLFFYVTEYAHRRAEELGKKLRFHMTTNGTLLDREVVEFLQKYDFGLIVSLDGPAHLHDESRPYANGKGSHAKILKNLEGIKSTEVSKKTTLRSTFTPARIALEERVLYLDGLVRQGYAGNFSVEPVSLSPGSPLAFDTASIRMLAKEYEELAPIFLERAREGNPIRFFHFENFVKRIVNNRRSINECNAGVTYMAVNPQEEIHACHHEGDCVIGSLDKGIDPALQEPWRCNDIRYRKTCTTCWARYVCGGGCMADAINHCGDPTMPDAASCGFRKALIRMGIWLAAGMPENDWQQILNGNGRDKAEE